MSFQQGLSGLNATSKSLEVIGNNIANSGTYGAKSSRAEFADFYAASLNGSMATSAGIGTYLASISQQFSQGSITATDNPLDLALNGRGFFQVSDGASPAKYTRNGQFKLDRDGYISTNSGLKLLGYEADLGTGQIKPGLAVPIKLPTGGIAPQATSEIDVQLNLDAAKKVIPATTPIDFTDASTYNNATSVTAYDDKGAPVALTYYFRHTSGPSEASPSDPDLWDVYVTANGRTVFPALAPDNSSPEALATLQFDPSGARLTAFTPNAAITDSDFDPVTGANRLGFDIQITAPDRNGIVPQPIAIGSLSFDVTQFAAPFGVTDMKQDGFSAGQLVSIGVEENGIVTARYSNGQTKSAGQIEVANFRNLQGLQPLGDNLWAFTHASGDPITGVPGEGNLGVLQAAALEESNIDLTGELVNMITAQRAYQANAQTIKTQDQVLQTLVNLR
ncbi:MAG: flagellar hook protein FlgE [Rubrivivax sp. SCN 71-131]|jgi:flagellar hook protein FlgE|nr:MAG: flagellar hook protein FlgE [Rubrivivax sp. SCN 71-131]